MNISKNYQAGNAEWLNPHNPTTPPPMGKKINILQSGRVQIVGQWRWDVGYLAWSNLIGVTPTSLKWIKENEQRNLNAVQQGATMSAIQTVIDWNKDAGNTHDSVNARQSAMYLGLQCEELAEKLQVVGLLGSSRSLSMLATNLKSGEYDPAVERTLATDAGRKEMLDGDMDLMVVSIGAAMSQGADVIGAFNEVLRSNDSKRTDGKLLKDANGKIIKPNHYSPANLEPFIIHPGPACFTRRYG
jgi:predicted HAD superfamily Cof-like phosphohydrolase